MRGLQLKKDRSQSPYQNLSEYSNMHRKQVVESSGLTETNNANQFVPPVPQGGNNLIQTSTGAYNVDFDAEYRARKLSRGVSPVKRLDDYQNEANVSSLERQ